MSDIGVIVTGAVGAAGIAGALLSARLTARWQLASLKLSISAQNERERLAEKRRIYASAAATLTDAYQATDRYGSAPTEFLPARTSALNAVSELTLIAPSEVSRLGWEAFIWLSREAGIRADWRDPASLAIGNLVTAMRADLGEPPIDIESLRVAGQAPDAPTAAESPPE